MKKTRQTLQYLLKSSSTGMIIGVLVILGVVATTDLVFFFTDQRNPVHQVVSLTVPFEGATGLFVFFLGLALFVADFKVALANGISRKTFFLASLFTAAIMAAAFSIFNLTVVKVHGLFWPINSINDVNYPRSGWAEQLLVQFSLQFPLYFYLILAGRLIVLSGYRCNTLAKWAISLAPFVLLILYNVADARFGGPISRAFNDYIVWSTNYPTTVFIMLAYAAFLCGLTYLAIRRAPVKG
jgi:hypothetical protein